MIKTLIGSLQIGSCIMTTSLLLHWVKYDSIGNKDSDCTFTHNKHILKMYKTIYGNKADNDKQYKDK